MGFTRVNGVYGTVATQSNSASTSVVLGSGQGAAFASATTTNPIRCAVIDTSTSPETLKFFLDVTGRSTDTLTVANRGVTDGNVSSADANILVGYTVAAVTSVGVLDGTYAPLPDVGLYAAMPATGTGSKKFYWASDLNGGTLFQDQTNGAAYTQVAAGVGDPGGKVMGYQQSTNPTAQSFISTDGVVDLTGMSFSFTWGTRDVEFKGGVIFNAALSGATVGGIKRVEVYVRDASNNLVVIGMWSVLASQATFTLQGEAVLLPTKVTNPGAGTVSAYKLSAAVFGANCTITPLSNYGTSPFAKTETLVAREA